MSTVPKPKTMLAWRKYHGVYEPTREEVPVPETPVDGYLVKILAAGICHSDYNLVNTDISQPLIEKYTLGHEGCGEIIEVGAHVSQESYDLRIGDKVAIIPVPGCGLQSCYCCTTINRHEICRAAGNYGLGRDGFFAEYAAVSARAVVPLPEGVSPAVGAVATDALLTAYHAVVKRASLGRDDTVCIIGLGGLGLNGLQVARHIGARTIVTDKRQGVLDAAISLGVPAEDVIPVDVPIVEFVKSRNLRIDMVIDFVGVDETCRAAQEIVRPAGKYILVGQMEPELPLMNTLCCIKRLEILFSFSGQIDDLKECLDLIQKGVIVPQVETDSMNMFPRLLNDLHHGKIKSRMALIP